MVRSLIFEKQAKSQKEAGISLSAALEAIVACTMHKVGNSSDVISQLLDAVRDNLRLNDQEAVHVRCEYQKLLTKLISVKDKCLELVGVRTIVERVQSSYSWKEASYDLLTSVTTRRTSVLLVLPVEIVFQP